ncbi:efflux RND transporter periplasmic adaptor subunit [Desulforhopalus singaporensis]|uniref:HlyD family secretion protein n=1 Tax=Desulforhopalus singaporensis TaxID=91360 RepID=A0A1H0LE15_9BACT|nr:efflux RND transporter periplasmic adaptor subunit [Desulforhopalus singaporensis]SDO66332.1 HlyD family secretion protein [Desulforhopalus singaporensis]
MTSAKRGKIFWILTLVIVAGAVVVMKFWAGSMGAVSVATLVVQRGTMETYVDERARTSLEQVYHVTMPLNGRILPLQAEEGDRVMKGQVIGRVEDADWKDAQVEVQSIAATFASWLDASKAQVAAARVQYDFDKWDWERHSRLAESSAISERQTRDIKRNYLDSRVQLESSQAMYYATRAMQAVVDLLPGYVNRNFDRTVIKSPVSGTVLKRHVTNEKVMTAGEPLLEIGNLKELEVNAEILTDEAAYVHVGDRVEIYGAGLDSRRLPGVVRLIEPSGFTKVSSLGVEEQRVNVKIAFINDAAGSEQEGGLGLGLNYRVRIKIITEQKKDTITVPRTALFADSEGAWQLFKVSDGVARLTRVEIGLANDAKAEIVSGLFPGDRIVRLVQAGLEDGVKVKLVE